MSARDFAEFYSAAFGSLTAQLHAFTGDHTEAQDVVQEAFCRAYARWAKVGTYDDPLAWVRRVAWNLAVSQWRRGRLLIRWHRDLAPEAVAAPTAASVDLARALAKLPANQRRVVVLFYLADMPVGDIATFVSAPVGTVKAWLHRARTSLGTLLGEEIGVADV